MTTIIHHASSLGAELTGELENGKLATFRGVPFATVEKRWTHSEVCDTVESPFDATQFGPRCPQGEGMVLVTGGVNDPAPGDDEFKCLNLNICVPKDALAKGSGSGLPVMAWIHG
jgi:carboxylesterase type B